MNFKKFELLKDEKNASAVYRILKESIIEGYLLPGENISEEDIKKHFGISRTLIRETLIKLSKENLIQIIPQKGTYVTLINFKAIEDFLFLRRLAEKEVFRLAVKEFDQEKLAELHSNLSFQKNLIDLNNASLNLIKLDNAFHKIIFEGCNKRNVWELLETSQLQYDRLRILCLKEGLTQNTMYEQHYKLYQAFSDKNCNLIEDILDNHLGHLDALYGGILKKLPHFFQI